MTTYELYINDILCDLSSDEVITLLYQSPIFSSLDSIQSNRSYNIALPPTPANMRAIGQAARPDVDANAPYVRLPAALYQDGVPLFTQGFAVVTDIADTINVVLTWGNADNFQPLFDANLRDLTIYIPAPEGAEGDWVSYIEWNENTQLLDSTGEEPDAAFWAINFGMGLSNPKYLHPSVPVSSILGYIEEYNGITIDGKDRLAYSPHGGPIVPLVSKNGDEISNKTEALRFTANSTNFKDKIYGVLGRGSIIQDPQNIAYGSCTTKFDRADYKVHITINPNDGAGSYSYFADTLTGWEIPEAMNLMLTEVDAKGGIVKSTALSTSYNVEYLGITDSGLRKYRFDFLALNTIYTLTETTEILLHYEVQTGVVYSYSNPYSETLTVNIWANWEDCAFPTKFPIAPNLPNISQGDFILAMMNMQGLFAYADKDNPNTIKLISIDDIIANVQKNDIIDWSDRVILNDIHRVDMPDASVFTIDDLAQSNILDYDNDDDVKTDTHGTITIRNENIEKEAELVELPFSASENENTAGLDRPCALVPIYEDDSKGGANYSECSPRILSVRGGYYNTIDIKAIGVFDPWMKFGGENGIVKTRYASYQKVVDRLRIITIRAKLTAFDLYNLDYTKPVYIAQFGQIFAIYSVETGEDGICDCQLLKLKVDGVVPVHYYLYLDGEDADQNYINVSADGETITYRVETNGTPVVASKDSRLTVTIGSLDTDGYYPLTIVVPKNSASESVTYTPVVVGVSENSEVRHSISIQQKAKPTVTYYLYLNGQNADQSRTVYASGGTTIYSVQSNGTPYVVSKDSRLTEKLQTAKDGTISLTIEVPQNTSDAGINYDPVILGISEADHVRRKISISQQGKEYYLTLNGSVGDISINIEAAAKQNRVFWSSNGTPQLSYSGDAVALAEVDADAVNIYSYANTTSEQRTGQVTVYLKEVPSIERKIVVIQEAAATERMIIIDVHACGVEAGDNIDLMIGLDFPWPIESQVLDDLTVRVSFNELSGMIGRELTDCVGELLYIEASSTGECWSGPVPASGDIEAELV